MIRVLWEDSPADGQLTEYGPHKLLVASLVDMTGQTSLYYDKQVESVPCKGNSKLLKRVKSEGTEQNLETLLQQLKAVDPDLVDGEVWKSALKKGRVERDIVLRAAAREKARNVRDQLRQHNSSFDYLVRSVVAKLPTTP